MRQRKHQINAFGRILFVKIVYAGDVGANHG